MPKVEYHSCGGRIRTVHYRHRLFEAGNGSETASIWVKVGRVCSLCSDFTSTDGKRVEDLIAAEVSKYRDRVLARSSASV